MKPMYGITGGMGCGKSTVVEMFREFSDVGVIKTDDISADLFEQDIIKEKLAEVLGEEILNGGQLDKNLIAQKIFNEHSLLKAVEGIIHPLVWEKVLKIVEEDVLGLSFYVVESAIIFETKKENMFQGIIAVYCPPDLQTERIKKRGFSDEDIKARVTIQISCFEKMQRSDYVVFTDGSFEETGKNVRKIYEQLKRRSQCKRQRFIPALLTP